MLYGVPPFKVNSMQELQQKVQTQSGNNTNFIPGVNISDNCKDLIRRLMQPDPAKRIEWKDFFKHAIFDQQGKNKGPTIYPLQVIYRALDFNQKIKLKNFGS